MLAAETRPVSLSEATPDAPEPLTDWKQIIQPLDGFLQKVAVRLAEQVQAFDPDLACYAEYALTNQGKQLRPALVGLSGGATGAVNDSHVTVAVIIEMVHLATLVHDDVVDEATLRRGRPTLAANWGNELSVLLGDCLFAHALKLAASFPTPEICRAVASATNTVCAGEILQNQQRNNFEISRDAYFKVLAMKTGELFALSCELGGFLNGVSPSTRAALRRYGLSLGTAYQLYDDCLDLFGSEARAGKSLGTDLIKGKLTLPLLLLLEGGDLGVRNKLQSLMMEWQPQFLPQVLALLTRGSTLNQSRKIIQQYLQTTREVLGQLPDSDSRGALAGLAWVLGRQADALGFRSA